MVTQRPLGTTEEVSAFARVPIQSIYYQHHRGVGLGALGIKIGRHLRFRWSDVEKFLDDHSMRAQMSAYVECDGRDMARADASPSVVTENA